ncbi:hypothetical protein KIPB_003388, partial [Kipferlia bialata]|eukprot:g3388.t1
MSGLISIQGPGARGAPSRKLPPMSKNVPAAFSPQVISVSQTIDPQPAPALLKRHKPQ